MTTEIEFLPRIVAFCCVHSAYQAADAAGHMRIPYPENILMMRIPCAGRVDTLHILRAFENGADGVVILACHEGACHHISGNIRAKERVERANALLREIGVDGRRVEMLTFAPSEGPRFAQVISELEERIKELGPSPFKGAMR
jgi:coenzyme F420-reducing hydrogenase delta subunit